MEEHCKNPWNKACDNTDIALYIFYKKQVLPICAECWIKIAKGVKNWGTDKRPPYKGKVTIEDGRLVIDGMIRVEGKEAVHEFDYTAIKRCSHCRMDKPLSEFAITRRTGRINSWCNKCCSDYSKKKRAKEKKKRLRVVNS